MTRWPSSARARVHRRLRLPDVQRIVEARAASPRSAVLSILIVLSARIGIVGALRNPPRVMSTSPFLTPGHSRNRRRSPPGAGAGGGSQPRRRSSLAAARRACSARWRSPAAQASTPRSPARRTPQRGAHSRARTPLSARSPDRPAARPSPRSRSPGSPAAAAGPRAGRLQRSAARGLLFNLTDRPGAVAAQPVHAPAASRASRR